MKDMTPKHIPQPAKAPTNPTANALRGLAASKVNALPAKTSVTIKGSVITTKSVAPPVRQLPQGMKHDKDLLLTVFHIQNPSGNRACNNHAMEVIESCAPTGCLVARDGKGNMMIRKGSNQGPHPYYLAHMDQVHDYEPFMKVHISGNMLHAVDGNDRQTGVGGDDKCGVYMALLMLHKLENCTAVFVRDEEVGCLGSEDVPLDWFDAAAFVIQADRNNRTMDIIRDTNGMTCASDEFMRALAGLPIVCAAGHTENTGSVTDIGELSSRGLPVSMVNISSGYHEPHSPREIVYLDELGIACQLAYEAACLLGDTMWRHTPESRYFNHGPTLSKGMPLGAQWDEREDYWKSKDPADRAYAEWVLDNDEAIEKEAVISDLVRLYGYDREFDCLDSWELDDLRDILDECDLAASRKG